MNIYKEWSGIQRDVTWSDINYTPFANRAAIHAMGKAISGNRDYILQGVTFSKTAGVDASVTAGYVYDETSGEVVQVEAQTVAETLGTNLWTLVKTTTYDAAGLNNYRTGGPNNNYQQERMVLTNVASIGSGFDIENTPALDAFFAIPDSDIDTSITTGVTVSGTGTATKVEFNRVGNAVHLVATILLVTSGYTPSQTIQFRWPDSHFDITPSDSNGIWVPAVFVDTSAATTPISGMALFSDATANYTTVTIYAPSNFADAKNYRVILNCVLHAD